MRALWQRMVLARGGGDGEREVERQGEATVTLMATLRQRSLSAAQLSQHDCHERCSSAVQVSLSPQPQPQPQATEAVRSGMSWALSSTGRGAAQLRALPFPVQPRLCSSHRALSSAVRLCEARAVRADCRRIL